MSRRRLALGLLAAGLLLAPLLAPRAGRRDPGPEAGPLVRLLGPVARLAASVQWVRVEEARAAGEHELAFARAETALALDPGATAGWLSLARYQGLYLASATRQPDPGLRRQWLVEAVATTRRGEELARAPAELAVLRALLLLEHAQREPPTPWPGGAAALWAEAALAFERAAELGHAGGHELARRTRERAGG